MSKLKKYIAIVGSIELEDDIVVHEYSEDNFLARSRQDVRLMLEQNGTYYEEICEIIEEEEN